jgi:hypothetical protein
MLSLAEAKYLLGLSNVALKTSKVNPRNGRFK